MKKLITAVVIVAVLSVIAFNLGSRAADRSLRTPAKTTGNVSQSDSKSTSESSSDSQSKPEKSELPAQKQGNETKKPAQIKKENSKTVSETKPDQKKKQPSGEKIICIDAGHQRYGNNALEQIGPGSSTKKPKVSSGTSGIATNKAESEVNLEIALKLQKILQDRGYKVVMVRTTQDVNISNIQRAEIANRAKADIDIRLHCNGTDNTSVHGYFILTPSSHNPYLSSGLVSRSLKLTQCLLPTIAKATGAANRGISYRDDLTGTNWSKVPTVLVEMGEMRNRQEDLNLSNASYQEKMATGIANGIDNYFAK